MQCSSRGNEILYVANIRQTHCFFGTSCQETTIQTKVHQMIFSANSFRDLVVKLFRNKRNRSKHVLPTAPCCLLCHQLTNCILNIYFLFHWTLNGYCAQRGYKNHQITLRTHEGPMKEPPWSEGPFKSHFPCLR